MTLQRENLTLQGQNLSQENKKGKFRKWLSILSALTELVTSLNMLLLRLI